jgi:hypothetical protein
MRKEEIAMKVRPSVEGVVTGIGLTLAASVLLPVVKQVARPLAEAGLQSATLLASQVKSGVSYLKEEIEDIVAEAQFERLKKSIDLDIANGEEHA